MLEVQRTLCAPVRRQGLLSLAKGCWKKLSVLARQNVGGIVLAGSFFRTKQRLVTHRFSQFLVTSTWRWRMYTGSVDETY